MRPTNGRPGYLYLRNPSKLFFPCNVSFRFSYDGKASLEADSHKEQRAVRISTPSCSVNQKSNDQILGLGCLSDRKEAQPQQICSLIAMVGVVKRISHSSCLLSLLIATTITHRVSSQGENS